MPCPPHQLTVRDWASACHSTTELPRPKHSSDVLPVPAALPCERAAVPGSGVNQPGSFECCALTRRRVGKLVVGDLRLLSEPGVASISVTAEQWVRSYKARNLSGKVPAAQPEPHPLVPCSGDRLVALRHRRCSVHVSKGVYPSPPL